MRSKQLFFSIFCLLTILLFASSALASGFVVIQNQTSQKLYPAIAWKLKDGNFRVYRCGEALPGSSLHLYAREYTKKLIWRFFALPGKAACGAFRQNGATLGPGAHPHKDITPPCQLTLTEKKDKIIIE